jgi:hypothetical protein
MTPEELRRMMEYLEGRVQPAEGRAVHFDVPTAEELRRAGFEEQAIDRILQAPWLAEMVEEVVETPEFCDPSDPPGRVLQYARDVVGEYLRKRYELDEI